VVTMVSSWKNGLLAVALVLGLSISPTISRRCLLLGRIEARIEQQQRCDHGPKRRIAGLGELGRNVTACDGGLDDNPIEDTLEPYHVPLCRVSLHCCTAPRRGRGFFHLRGSRRMNAQRNQPTLICFPGKGRTLCRPSHADAWLIRKRACVPSIQPIRRTPIAGCAECIAGPKPKRPAPVSRSKKGRAHRLICPSHWKSGKTAGTSRGFEFKLASWNIPGVLPVAAIGYPPLWPPRRCGSRRRSGGTVRRRAGRFPGRWRQSGV
jgi:hypothetical protein